MPHLVLDPGHGGSTDAGRSSYGGRATIESTLNLELCRRVRDAVGPSIALTREMDENVALAERIRSASGALGFVSVHAHPCDEPRVWVHHDAPQASRELAGTVARYLGAQVGREDLAVLSPSHHGATAACLVEYPLRDLQRDATLAVEQLGRGLRAHLGREPRFGNKYTVQVGDYADTAPKWWEPKPYTDRAATLGHVVKDIAETAIPYKRAGGPRAPDVSPAAAPNPKTSPFVVYEDLLTAVGDKIGRVDATALVFGADKDFAFPYWATRAKAVDLASTDSNAPRQRLVNLIAAAKLDNLKPGYMELHDHVEYVFVTPNMGANNYQFRTFDCVYSGFFDDTTKAMHSAEQYDFMLDKMSYLTLDVLGTGKYLAMLANNGHWITDFELLATDQTPILELLGYQEVTGTVLSKQLAAKKFGNDTLHVYKNVKGYPQKWRETVGFWYCFLKHHLDGTRLGRGVGVGAYMEEEYQEAIDQGRMIYYFLDNSGLQPAVVTHLRLQLDLIYGELARMMLAATKS